MLMALLAQTFDQMLRAASVWLRKAGDHATGELQPADSVASLRLAPDMLPLAGQIRLACFQVYEAGHLLRDEPAPPAAEALRTRGRDLDDDVGTLAELQQCIQQALDHLADQWIADAPHDGPASISLDGPNGIVFDMTAEDYLRDWALPQFYFHMTMTYAILRNHGVALGKADYAMHMLRHLREPA